jgi:hypothetical protein
MVDWFLVEADESKLAFRFYGNAEREWCRSRALDLGGSSGRLLQPACGLQRPGPADLTRLNVHSRRSGDVVRVSVETSNTACPGVAFEASAREPANARTRGAIAKSTWSRRPKAMTARNIDRPAVLTALRSRERGDDRRCRRAMRAPHPVRQRGGRVFRSWWLVWAG